MRQEEGKRMMNECGTRLEAPGAESHRSGAKAGGRFQSFLIPALLTTLLFASCGDDPTGPDGGFIPPGRSILVVNGLAETLSVVSLEDWRVYNNTVELGRWPNDVASDDLGTRIFVINSGDNQVMAIDTESGEVTARIDVGVGENPYQCAVAGPFLWVSSFLTGRLSIIDTEEEAVDDRLELGTTLQTVKISGGVVYVTDSGYEFGSFGEGRVTAVDAVSRAVLGTQAVGTNPQDVLADGLGHLHVLCTGSYAGDGGGTDGGEIHVLDATTLAPLDTLALGGNPNSLTPGPGSVIYAAGYWGGLMAIDAASLEVTHGSSAPLLAGDGYMDIVYDGQTGLVFLAEFDEDRIVVYDPQTGETTRTAAVGDGPLRIHVFGGLPGKATTGNPPSHTSKASRNTSARRHQ